MKRIPLAGGKFAKVDDEDYEYLSQWRWREFHGYATARERGVPSVLRKTFQMHRLLLKPKKGFEVDHINRDRLDNRRSNLRLATRSLNRFNTAKYQNKSSIYKGVYWHKGSQIWRTQLKHNGKFIYLGQYKTEEEAGRAYDRYIRKVAGEFAVLNFPK